MGAKLTFGVHGWKPGIRRLGNQVLDVVRQCCSAVVGDQRVVTLARQFNEGIRLRSPRARIPVPVAIDVVSLTAPQGIVAAQTAVEDVVAAVADNEVVKLVADGVDAKCSRKRDVFDVVRQNVPGCA